MSRSPDRQLSLAQLTDITCRFGNFIGEEAEASEEESDHGRDANNYVYDDASEVGADGAGADLMEVDGTHFTGYKNDVCLGA